jgi:hypothetical protein
MRIQSLEIQKNVSKSGYSGQSEDRQSFSILLKAKPKGVILKLKDLKLRVATIEKDNYQFDENGLFCLYFQQE